MLYITPVDDNKRINDLAGHPISQFTIVSGITLMIVDWLFELDLEIAHAWNSSSWSVGRVLYFLTRYIAFLDMPIMLYSSLAYSIPSPLCAPLNTAYKAIGICGMLVAELIMTIRVWALWNRRRDIGIILVTMSSVNLIASVTTYVLTGGAGTHYTNLDGIPGCFTAVPQGNATAWAYIPLVVHQTFIFSMTAVKGAQHYRMGIYGTSLINTFYRDGIVYYAFLMAFSLLNLDTNKHEDLGEFYFLTNYSLQRIMHSILSARMLLHLRQGPDTYGDSQVFESINFVSTAGTGVSLTPVAQIPEELRGGWFGQEESPALARRRVLRTMPWPVASRRSQ